MKISLRFLFTAGLGAAAMYYFDPDRGRQRRATLRERLEQDRATGTAEHRTGEHRTGTKGRVGTGESPRDAAATEGRPDQPEPMH